MINAEMLKLAMESGMGPLADEFETPELKRIHDLWIAGSKMIQEAEEALKSITEKVPC